MKNLWRFYSDRNSPWVRLLQLLHYTRRDPSAGGNIPTGCSPMWKGSLSTSAPFNTSVRFSLGDGMMVTFWHGRWAGEDLLRNRFPALFAASSHKHLVVNRWVQRFSTRLNLGFRDCPLEASSELHRLRSLVSGLSLSSLPDAIEWNGATGGGSLPVTPIAFWLSTGGTIAELGICGTSGSPSR